MKKILVLAIINLIFFSFAFAQGTIRGKVSDKNGETLIGVTVVLKSNRSVGIATDLDGNYSLKITDASPQVILVSYVSYKTIEETVHPVNGEVIIKNFVLESASNDLGVIEVETKRIKNNDSYIENLKINSATSIDAISNKTMAAIGAPNITEAVKHVSGVSTNGGFITVRGIGDRYVKTTINGSRIPTLDPFTNNIKLDLFPASLVDNVIITKTASPDLPGDWAGAYLSVETKDYPEQLAVNIETAVGYNTQSTFKEMVSSEHSRTDWLGYDNSMRDRTHDGFVAVNANPSTYQQLVALGLGSYYNSLGVTGNNWNDDYYKLGLIQLGLLDKAKFNDNAAFTDAKTKYNNGTYQSDAFYNINANAAESGKSFANNWNTIMRKAPLNFTQSFSIGDQVQLFGKPLGFIAGFRYGNSTQYDPNAIASRLDGQGRTTTTGNQIGKETNGWSALINLAYKLNPNHTISLLFMPNLTGVNNARNSLDDSDPGQFVVTKSQYYEQRKQLVYQFKSEHYIPKYKLKIEANASYTDGKSSAPDFKNLQYWKNPSAVPGVYTYQIGGTVGDGVRRYYRYLSDNIFDSRLSAELPIMSVKDKPELIRKLKFGGAYQTNEKKSDQYVYALAATTKLMTNDNIDDFFKTENFGIHNYTDPYGIQRNTIDLYYDGAINNPANHTLGSSKIIAGFAMLDYSIVPRLRFAGGLRVEQANIFADVYQFHSLGYESDDIRRYGLKPAKLNELSYLPSANIIYKIKKDEAAPVNLRVNYSQTVARPSIRELTNIENYDYELRGAVVGNPDLKIVHINNYDLRFESYFKNGDNVSVSVFYKDFKNHIELVNSGTYTWQNASKSYAKGIELEGKKIITKHFDFRANITFVNSSSTIIRTSYTGTGFIPRDTVKRTMFGQAPYVVNAMFTYTADSLGLSATLSYNIQGARLVIAASQKEIPDIYELPRNLVDLKISKKLGTHYNVSITVRDILNQSITRRYKGTNIDYDRYKYGSVYLFSVSYKL